MSKNLRKKHSWGSNLLRKLKLKRKDKKDRTFSNRAQRPEKDYASTADRNVDAARSKGVVGGLDASSLLKPETFTESPTKASQKAASSLAPSQGVFNIPIVIDPMETNRLEKTNASLTPGSLKCRHQDGSAESNSNSLQSLSVQTMEREKPTNERREEATNRAEKDTTDSHHAHTTFETFLSFAHNALSHIPKINVQEGDDGSSSKNESRDQKKNFISYTKTTH